LREISKYSKLVEFLSAIGLKADLQREHSNSPNSKPRAGASSSTPSPQANEVPRSVFSSAR
jgi:hypothetical protein